MSTGKSQEFRRNFRSLFGVAWSAGWLIQRLRKWTRAGIAHGGLGADRAGDSVGKLLAVARVRAKAGFGRTAEVATFEKQAWDFWVTREANPTANETAISAFVRTNGVHRLLATDCEAVAIHTPVVSFRATNTRWAAIKVHTNEDAAVLVGPGDALIEIHEGVIAAHQDGFKIAAELRAEAFRHIEGEILFLLPSGRADRTAVLAAVSGINDYGMKSLRSRPVAPDIAP